MAELNETDIFWILLLVQLGIITQTSGLTQLLAAGAIVGTLYLGTKKELI